MANDKIQVHRRGFLAKLLKGAAATAVASATVIEVTESKAGAVEAKVVPDSSLENNLSFDDDFYFKLRKKLVKDTMNFTRQDCVNLATCINKDKNAWRVMETYLRLQQSGERILATVHYLVVYKILYIASHHPNFVGKSKLPAQLVDIPLMDGKDEERFGSHFVF